MKKHQAKLKQTWVAEIAIYDPIYKELKSSTELS